MLFIRRFHSIGKPFRSIKDVAAYLESPTWSTGELLSELPVQSEVKLDNLLTLSGLSVSPEKRNQLEKSIRNQLAFINYVEELEVGPVQRDARLMPEPKPLKYADLVQPHTPDASKGETTESWQPTKLASVSEDGYFVLKDSLK